MKNDAKIGLPQLFVYFFPLHCIFAQARRDFSARLLSSLNLFYCNCVRRTFLGTNYIESLNSTKNRRFAQTQRAQARKKCLKIYDFCGFLHIVDKQFGMVCSWKCVCVPVETKKSGQIPKKKNI